MSDYLQETLATDMDYTAGTLPGTTQQADPFAPGVAGSAGASLGTGTGQHGAVPVEAGPGGGIMDAFKTVFDWLHQPFIGGASPSDVFLLVGIVLVGIIAWNLILFHIRVAAETL